MFLQFCQNQKWAIEPETAKVLLGVLDRWLAGNNNPLPYKGRNKDENALKIAMIAADGRITYSKSKNYQDATGEVAIIPIVGPMFKRGGAVYDSSGARDTRDVINQLRQADLNPAIKGIVLEVDSPGGTVDGTESLAKAIREMSKPVVAFGDGLVASAACWVVSQTDFIYLSSSLTSDIGSIGTLMVYENQAGWLQSQGREIKVFRAEKSKDKAIVNSLEPLSEQAIANINTGLNEVNDFFISEVKKGRGNKLSKSEDVFTGKLYNGNLGIKHGLADAIGSLDDAVNKVLSLAKTGSYKRTRINKNNQTQNQSMSLKKWFSNSSESDKKTSTDTGESISVEASELNELKADMEETQKALDACQKAKADLETQVKTLNTTIESQTKEISSLKEKVTSLEKKPKEDAAAGAHKEGDQAGDTDTERPLRSWEIKAARKNSVFTKTQNKTA